MKTYIIRQLRICIILYLGQLLTGFALGWSAPVLPKLRDPEQSPIEDELTNMDESLVGSLLLVGAIIGPFIAGIMSNRVGRKPSMIMSGIISIIAYIILAVPNGLAMIFVGRILKGLGTSSISVLNLVYIGEIASTNLRGTLLTGTAIFTTSGTLIVYSIGSYFSYSTVTYVGMALTAIYCVGIFFVPESPMFYVIKDDEKMTKQILFDLGRSEDFGEVMSFRCTKVNTSATEEWKQIVTVKSNRKALFITVTLMILQQLSGVMVVIFFATTIFEIADSSIEPDVATIIIGVTQVFATSLTTLFVERNGRKIMLLISTAFCAISLASLGTYFYLDEFDHPTADKVKWLPLVSLILYFLGFDLGLGIIPGTLIGEMYQSTVRSTGSAVTTSTGIAFGFAISSVFVSMITGLGGHVTFWMFSGACVLAFMFTAVFVPETKGKTLLEIKEMLSK